MGRKNRRLLPPGTGRRVRVLESALGPGKLLKMIFCGHTGRSASISDPAMKGDGFTRAAAGTASSYSVLTLTVMTPAGMAK